SGRASAAGIALSKPGRRPRERSAESVNWDTARTLPPTSARERFIFPAPSSKMRRPATFRAASSASLAPSPFSAPTRTSNPRPTEATGFPSTRTSERETRWTTSFMRGGRRKAEGGRRTRASSAPRGDPGELRRLRSARERRREPVDRGAPENHRGEEGGALPATRLVEMERESRPFDRGAHDRGGGGDPGERRRDRPTVEPAFAAAKHADEDREIDAGR